MDLKNTLIRASAGSGKTYQLSNRYLELVSGNTGAESIFAATFTRKAAGEILARILVRMAKAATEETERLELCKALGKDPREFDHATILDLLVRTVRVLHRLNVGTLDAFFVKVAEAFSFELELPGGWSITDELNKQRHLEEAVRRVVASMRPAETVSLMHMLNKGESKLSVRSQLLSLADSLIEVYRSAKPGAWRKLPRRNTLDETELDDLLQRYNDAPLPTDSRASEAHRKEYDRIASGNWDDFLDSGFGNSVALKKYTYYQAKIEGELAAVLDRLVDHAMALRINDLATQTEATGEILARIAKTFEDVKREERALLFSDVTYHLANPPRTIAEETLVHRIDARMRHLLLDEFQDTSPAQWDALRRFVNIALDGTTRTSGQEFRSGKDSRDGQGSFFCVGDVKQAIYAWRGGVSAIFDTVEDEVDALHKETLQVSWRSAPAVLDAVNVFFGNVTKNAFLIDATKYPVDVDAAKNWHRGFEKHQPAPKNRNLSGYCVLESSPLAGSEEAERLFTSTPGVEALEDFGDETGAGGVAPGERKQAAVTLAYAIRRIGELSQTRPLCRIGVLTRRNETIAKLIYGLRRAGIDASEEGGNPLTDSAAVEIVLSALKLADHPGDTVVRFHLAGSVLGKHLGLTGITDESTGDESDNTASGSSRNTASRVALAIRRQIMRDGFGQTLRDWAKILARDCDDRELSRVLQLVEKAHLYDAKKETIPRCDAFVEYIRSEKVNKPRPAAVRVMTIHQSKGLEFDIVVLPELDGKLAGEPPLLVVGRPNPTAPIERVLRYADSLTQGFLPKEFQEMFRDSRQTRIEEALCVLYVAMTRARRELVMIVPGKKPTTKAPKARKTFEGILRSGLLKDFTADKPGAVLFENGDSNWFDVEADGQGRKPPESQENVPQTLETLDLHLAPAPAQARRMLRRYTPSSHEEAEPEDTVSPTAKAPGIMAPEMETPNFPVEQEFSDTSEEHDAGIYGGGLFLKRDEFFFDDSKPHDRRFALLYGTAMHAAFELVDWLDVETPSRDAVERALLRVFQAELPPREAKARTRAAMEDFLALCKRSDICEALSLGERDPRQYRVFRERPFLISYKDGLMRGSIDRLVLRYDAPEDKTGGKYGNIPAEVEIIDFKTDRISSDPEKLKERSAHYAPQLEAYRTAVAKLYGISPASIRTRLLFTSSDVKNA